MSDFPGGHGASAHGPAEARPGTGAALALIGIAFVVTYASVLRDLVQDWGANEDYSHGFIVAPLAAYMAWQRRGDLRSVSDAAPSRAGLPLLIVALVLLAAGTLAAELFVARVSLVVALAAIVLFLGGWKRLRILAFPIGFLLLMIPIPAIVFNQLTFPLQLIASRLGETALWAMNVPVHRQGNILMVPNAALEVADACSGIRSLVSLVTLSLIYGHFTGRGPAVKAIMAIAAVPIAVLTNSVRVGALGAVAYAHGAAAVEGVFHDVSGWVVFAMAFGLLLWLYGRLDACARTPLLAALRRCHS